MGGREKKPGNRAERLKLFAGCSSRFSDDANELGKMEYLLLMILRA